MLKRGEKAQKPTLTQTSCS